MSQLAPRRSRRPTTVTKGDLKEQALLSVARRLLDEGSFAEASVADLAREAGLSRASFYFYFASKQLLLGAVVTGAVEELNARLSDEVGDERDRSAAELVAATVRAACELWWQHRPAMVAGVELGVALPEVYEQGMANVALVRGPTVDLLRAHGRVPEAHDAGEAEHLVTALILMTERNFYDLARRDATRKDYDALADRLARVWQRAFGVADD
jgi:TetR/AcrR family transcriptional regulator, ethionamide resistance regulator